MGMMLSKKRFLEIAEIEYRMYLEDMFPDGYSGIQGQVRRMELLEDPDSGAAELWVVHENPAEDFVLEEGTCLDDLAARWSKCLERWGMSSLEEFDLHLQARGM